jgi:hypothetical protein
MQAAAKRKEAEIDSKVANAFEFLTCVLLNSHRGVVEGRDDGGGDYDDATACSSVITTGTYALLGWGNTLQQLLQQLATNDSMLDISERSNLYLKMVQFFHLQSKLWFCIMIIMDLHRIGPFF